MIFVTDGGTTFTVKDGMVTIMRSGQPEITVPVADLLEFLRLIDED